MHLTNVFHVRAMSNNNCVPPSSLFLIEYSWHDRTRFERLFALAQKVITARQIQEKDRGQSDKRGRLLNRDEFGFERWDSHEYKFEAMETDSTTVHLKKKYCVSQKRCSLGCRIWHSHS